MKTKKEEAAQEEQGGSSHGSPARTQPRVSVVYVRRIYNLISI